MSTIPIRRLVTLLLVSAGVTACNRPQDEPPRRQEPAATPAPAESPPPGTPGASSTPSPPTTVASAAVLEESDRNFVSTATAGGLAEAEAGRTVAGKTANQDVKRFAEMLEQDHSKANTELARIASIKGFTPDTQLPAILRTHLDELDKRSGAELDKTFLQYFGTSAHEETITQFERESADGKDPDLRAFAQQTLPDLRKHLEMARQLQQSVRGAGSAKSR